MRKPISLALLLLLLACQEWSAPVLHSGPPRGCARARQVVVDSIQSDVALRVTDLAGHVGTSNTFLLQ